MKGSSPNTPGTSKFLIGKPVDDVLKNFLSKTKNYSRQELGCFLSCNAFKAWYCKCDSRIVEGHRWYKPGFIPWDAIVLKYVLNTRSCGLMLEPIGSEKQHCKNICFSNRNYTGNLVTGRRVSGFVLYVLGVTVSWQSTAQRSMTLCSSGGKRIGLLEAVKKLFCSQTIVKHDHFN